jgi:hypothetical protein
MILARLIMIIPSLLDAIDLSNSPN